MSAPEPNSGTAYHQDTHEPDSEPNSILVVPVHVRERATTPTTSHWHLSTFIKRLNPRRQHSEADCSGASANGSPAVVHENHVVLIDPSTTYDDLDQDLRLHYRAPIEEVSRESRAGELLWVCSLVGHDTRNESGTSNQAIQRVPINERDWQTVKQLMKQLGDVRIELSFSVLPAAPEGKMERPDEEQKKDDGSDKRPEGLVKKYSSHGAGCYPMGRSGMQRYWW